MRMPELSLVETTRSAARAQGYAVGWAEGRREAEAAVRAETDDLVRAAAAAEDRRAGEHAAALAALGEAAASLREELARTCRRVDEQAGGLALELTRALVGATTPDPAHVLARVTGLLPEHAVCSVRLHPDVAATAGDLGALGISVVPDPALGPGDAVARADDHVVDLRVDEALARLREALS
ncbi:hypothetical protein ASG94_09075 [Nocardioides sp. Soil805]|nr:hypothetical protein ASG94_09075 [Nocardioides sp. Soil805]